MGANSQVGPGRSVVAEENLLARLDRAPVTRSIKIIIGLLMLAWIIEAFDIGIIAPAILIIKSSWHATAKEIGLLEAPAPSASSSACCRPAGSRTITDARRFW